MPALSPRTSEVQDNEVDRVCLVSSGSFNATTRLSGAAHQGRVEISSQMLEAAEKASMDMVLL